MHYNYTHATKHKPPNHHSTIPPFKNRMNPSVAHISIGCNCAPRSFLKTNLNLSKQGGYNSGPFDLCITPYEAFCKALETDFANFFDDLHTIPWGATRKATGVLRVRDCLQFRTRMVSLLTTRVVDTHTCSKRIEFMHTDPTLTPFATSTPTTPPPTVPTTPVASEHPHQNSPSQSPFQPMAHSMAHPMA